MQRYDSYKDSGIQWLGQIPGHWEISKVRTHFIQRTDKVSELDFPPLSVSKQGIVPQLDDVAISQAEGNTRKLVRAGDFVVNSRSDRKGSCGVSPLDGSVSLINIVLEPHDIANQYIHYLFRMNDWIEDFYRYGRGIVADLWTTNYQQMKNMLMPIPPLAEQKAIVTYLDGETEKIDSFISSKEKEIRLLEELKQAEIANAVTKGLHPDVPLKDSGITWLGQIPGHWEILRFGALFKLKPFKEHCDKDEMLSVFLDRGVIRACESDKRTHNPSEDLSKYQLIEPSDFVMNNQQAWRGSVGVSALRGIISPAYHIFTLPNNLNPEYANIMLRDKNMVSQYEIASRGVGSIQRTLNFNWLNASKVILPPLDEQREIVDYINHRCETINKLTTELDSEITQLKEYKQRLIADAVTGQIKVC